MIFGSVATHRHWTITRKIRTPAPASLSPPRSYPHSRRLKFFDMLKASEEPLHEHTTVSVLAFITHITSIKSKFTFSSKCYKELLRLFSDVLPSNHKMPKDMYQSKKLLSALGMEYEKIDICKDNYMIFYKEHKNEKKCLKFGKPRFVEIVNEDGHDENRL
jgi:hypothetical protein